jgi:hypothetical protein
VLIIVAGVEYSWHHQTSRNFIVDEDRGVSGEAPTEVDDSLLITWRVRLSLLVGAMTLGPR